MTNLLSLTPTLVIAQAAPAGPNMTGTIFMMGAMFLIFYFLVIMPQRKRTKKVQEFQAALKVGDRVITTGGIYGQVTRISENSIQLQVADKVRIEVARASVGGYQGQEPVVQQDSTGGM